MTNPEHEKVLNESIYKHDYEICTKDESSAPGTSKGLTVGFFRNITGSVSRWIFSERMAGTNPDNEYIFLRYKRNTKEWIGALTLEGGVRLIWRNVQHDTVWHEMRNFLAELSETTNYPASGTVSITLADRFIATRLDINATCVNTEKLCQDE